MKKGRFIFINILNASKVLVMAYGQVWAWDNLLEYMNNWDSKPPKKNLGFNLVSKSYILYMLVLEIVSFQGWVESVLIFRQGTLLLLHPYFCDLKPSGRSENRHNLSPFSSPNLLFFLHAPNSLKFLVPFFVFHVFLVDSLLVVIVLSPKY